MEHLAAVPEGVVPTVTPAEHIRPPRLSVISTCRERSIAVDYFARRALENNIGTHGLFHGLFSQSFLDMLKEWMSRISSAASSYIASEVKRSLQSYERDLEAHHVVNVQPLGSKTSAKSNSSQRSARMPVPSCQGRRRACSGASLVSSCSGRKVRCNSIASANRAGFAVMD